LQPTAAASALKHPGLDIRFAVIAGLVPAIHLAEAWTTGTSPVVTMGEKAAFQMKRETT